MAEYFINYDFKETGCEFGAKVESEVEPIQLTEDILLKCGFSKANGYKQGGYEITTYEDGYILDNGYQIMGKTFFYLHQLQNLYFALTNEELNIEL